MGKNEYLRIQTIMMGGRRCGKTSVLTAMKSNFEDSFATSPLSINCENFDTLDVLDKKRNELLSYFHFSGKRNFTPDSNPTSDMRTFSFSIRLKNNQKSSITNRMFDKYQKIVMDFVDYPGEWIEKKEYYDKLKKEINKSQCIIISIDTPHMMEEDGIYNEYRNVCHRITETLKMVLENINKNMLILFVPLKCERYLLNKENNEQPDMDIVCKKVQESYKELINYLKKSSNNYTVAITPIFTLGAAAFSHFERDLYTGDIKINKKYNTPENPIYYFPDLSIKEPQPQYCEQPVVYLLTFIMQMARDKKHKKLKKANLFETLGIIIGENLFNISSYTDYENAKKELLKNIKITNDGYCILQNPFNF